MKKSWLFLAPFLVIAIVFFAGCGNTQPEPEIDESSISFGCDNYIYIKMGTTQNASALAPIVTDSKQSVIISYDRDVIDYDSTTGVITPVEQGRTMLMAQTKTSAASIEVVVERAIYCTDFDLSPFYKIKLEGNKETAPIEPFANNGYNMGFEFESLNPAVATIDANGIVTPVSEGEAVIRVYAKSGFVGSEYTLISRTTKVIVEPVATEYNIELLDSNAEPLEKVNDSYHLYLKNNLMQPFYILKIQADISLKSAVHKLIFISPEASNDKNSADYLDFNADLQAYSPTNTDEKVVYMPFYAVSSGFIQYSLCDAGLNHSNWLNSQVLNIEVSPLVSEINFSSNIEDKIFYLEENSIGYVEVDVDFGDVVNAEFDLSTTDNFKDIRIVGKTIYLDVDSTGFYSFTITAKDPFGKLATFSFEVRKKWPDTENFVRVSSKTLELTVGDYVILEYELSSATSDAFYCIEVDSDGNSKNSNAFEIDALSVNFYIEALKTGQYYVKITNGSGLESDIISILVK